MVQKPVNLLLFQDVNAVIFIAAISEYDQVLFEDETTV